MWTCITNSSCENLIKYKINIWYIKNTLELMSKNWQCPKFSGDKYGQGSRLEDLTTAKQRQRRKEEEGRAAVVCVCAHLRIVADNMMMIWPVVYLPCKRAVCLIINYANTLALHLTDLWWYILSVFILLFHILLTDSYT
jgi:hypothetical protein